MYVQIYWWNNRNHFSDRIAGGDRRPRAHFLGRNDRLVLS